MKLRLTDPKNILDDNFCKWLITKIRDKIIADIDVKKLQVWDAYFNSEKVYKSIYKKHLLTYDIICAGANSLTSKLSNTDIIFEINNNIYFPGLDRIKLSALCKLINFGNMQISSYPIFTNTFTYFAENIQDYVDRYLLGLL